MVVVVGSPLLAEATLRPGRRAGGLATGIALAAAASGAVTEMVGKVGDDPEGDALIVELERDGVGHAALLRDPAAPTSRKSSGEAAPLARADVELALRYLPEARVIVQVDRLEADAADAVADAAGYDGAHLVLVDGAPAYPAGESLTQRGLLTRIKPPARDEGAFASFVGRYAAALDAGRPPATAFRDAVEDVGWEPTRD